MPPELAIRFEKARRNLLWFNEHVRELEVYERYRGRYVAAASEELFVADTPQEIDQLVHDKYPDEVPHVRTVLGRDVTDNFDVIYSFPQREVILLARPTSIRFSR